MLPGVGNAPDEVVVAVGPAFGDALRATIGGLSCRDVLALLGGIREKGATSRVVRVRGSSDVAFVGHDGARLSGSGIGIGLQSRGTALIQSADLEPRDNLELFGMAPSLALESYRQIGRKRGGLRARAWRLAGADRARQLRAREADREDRAAPRARDGRGRL